MSNLSPRETIELIQQIYSLLLILTKNKSLAGVILTDGSFTQVRREFGDAKIPYSPAPGLDFDPGMENSFVVDGLLILRGTQLQ